jgi:AcrR family transcriptional regulator
MPDMQNLSPLKVARRDKILEAAEALFIEQGYRGATMEGIAEAVGMSKVTVYGYFSDKDSIFAAVADRVATRLQEAVDDALDGEGTSIERISAALIAKHGIIFDLVRSSPFAKDLFIAKSRTSADRFTVLDRSIEAKLCEVFVLAGRPTDDAERLAHLIFSASQGIANGSASKSTMSRDVATLVQAMCKILWSENT